MKLTTKTLCVILLFATNAILCQAQEIHSFLRSIDSIVTTSKETFSSVEGRFSIALPKSHHIYIAKNGGMFQWRLNEGYYFIGYTERQQNIEFSNKTEEKALQVAEEYSLEIAKSLFKNSPTRATQTNKPIKFEGHKGIEFRNVMPKGLSIIRVFWVKNRAYIEAVFLIDEQQKHEATALQVFNSIKLLKQEDADAIIKKKVEEATPKPLPQTPFVESVRPNAEDVKLKSNIKSIVTEWQGLSGKSADRPRRLSSEMYYNEQGSLIKEIRYNYAGLPFLIDVYGYIDNKSVSKHGFIKYESDLHINFEFPCGKIKKPDPRYDEWFEYKYNEKNNLIEASAYCSNGKLNSRSVTSYNGNIREVKLYNQYGELDMRVVLILDAERNALEVTYFGMPEEGWETKRIYKYEKFDAKGNWTRRIETAKEIHNGQIKEEWASYHFRTITYYSK